MFDARNREVLGRQRSPGSGQLELHRPRRLDDGDAADAGLSVAEVAERAGVPIEGPQREERFWIDMLPNYVGMFDYTYRWLGGWLARYRAQLLAVEGVQFHPESILSEHGHAMLRNFLNLPRR